MLQLSEKIRTIDFFSRHLFSHVESTGSTNDDLKLKVEQGLLNNILLADNQTHGRGQFQRKWQSAPGRSLLFSFSGSPADSEFPLSLTTGIAVYGALNDAGVSSQSGLWLKWPNDIYLHRRKLGGILVETVYCGQSGSFVIGIGINLQKPEKIDAADLADFSICRESLLIDILEHFSSLLKLPAEVLACKWREAAAPFWAQDFVCHEYAGHEMPIKSEPSSVRPIDLADDGSLLVRKNGKLERLHSASLSLE